MIGGRMSVDMQQLSAVLEKLTPDESRMVLQFADFLAQQRRYAIDERIARRKVSAWLVQEVGNLLMGGGTPLHHGGTSCVAGTGGGQLWLPWDGCFRGRRCSKWYIVGRRTNTAGDHRQCPDNG